MKAKTTEQAARQEQFIEYLKSELSYWPKGAKYLVSFRGQKFINFHARDRVDSLCNDWSVCSKKDWSDSK